MVSMKIIAYFILVNFITWLIWLVLVVNEQFAMNLAVLPYQHFFGSFGPMLAAAIVSLYSEKGAGLKQYLLRCFRPTVNFRWLVFAIGLPLLFFLLAVLTNWLLFGQKPVVTDFGITEKLPGFNFAAAWLIWLLTFGIGEESGWRGFALRELQQTMKPAAASLTLGVMWALWHLPAFFFDKDYMAMGGLQIAGWLLSILYGSVLMGWLYNSSGGSVLAAALWHGTFDSLIASKGAVGMVPAFMSMLVILLAIAVLKQTKGKLGYQSIETSS